MKYRFLSYVVLPVGLTCKTLFPQESQFLQGLFARLRMLHPECYFCYFDSVRFLVIFVQYNLHPLIFLSFAKLSVCNVASKREQTKACFQYVEREQFRHRLNLCLRDLKMKIVFSFLRKNFSIPRAKVIKIFQTPKEMGRIF